MTTVNTGRSLSDLLKATSQDLQAMAGANNKRKRESQDQVDPIRAAPATDFEQTYLQHGEDEMENPDTSSEFAAMLAQHNAGQDADRQHTSTNEQQQASDTATAALAQYHTMTVPQPTEQSFMAQPTEGGERSGSGSYAQGETAQQRTGSYSEYDLNKLGESQGATNGQSSPADKLIDDMLGGSKPAVGSDEWHKVRRDNHKEVERRRRETINEGINELAKIVPGSEKNKGSILQRAVQFITQLKENETQNIEKWTLEKLLTEQAIAELSSTCDKLKAECSRAWAEAEQWKKEGQKTGANVDEKAQVDGDGTE